MGEFCLDPVKRVEQHGDTQVTHLRAGLTGIVEFDVGLPFWSRVKVLFGWDLHMSYALDGKQIVVGELTPPAWWPFS